MNTSKPKYEISDLNPMSWEEFGEILSTLKSRIVSSKTQHDVFVPILRSGAMPCYSLAIGLGITKIAPLFKKGTGYVTNAEGESYLKGANHILVCETNVHSGKTVNSALQYLADSFPNATRSLLVVAWSYGAIEPLVRTSELYIGVKTNEGKKASDTLAESLSLRPGVTIFPWESADLELKELNS